MENISVDYNHENNNNGQYSQCDYQILLKNYDHQLKIYEKYNNIQFILFILFLLALFWLFYHMYLTPHAKN